MHLKVSLLVYKYTRIRVTPRHISSDTAGAHQMPSPPPTPIQTANAAAMITIPLPKEIIRDSFGRSMAVKYPAPVILNPTTRNDRLNILNTDAESV